MIFAMTMPAHKLIEQRREQLGLGADEVACRIGLSASEYHDVEAYNDELTMVVPLETVRALASVLELELSALLTPGVTLERHTAGDIPRHIMLLEARRKLSVSTAQMADDIGFHERFVHAIESDSQTLETYPYEVFKIVANYLGLDPMRVVYAYRSESK